MKLLHMDVLSQLSLKPVETPAVQIAKVRYLTEDEKAAKLSKLNYNPNAATTILKIGYNDEDENNLRCDFFESVGDRLECLICDMHIKTTNVSHLLKHLRMQHNIFQWDPTKQFIPKGGTPHKRPRFIMPLEPNKTAPLPGNYESPSLLETNPDYVWNFFELSNDRIICMCCGLEFTRKYQISLVKHLQIMHSVVFENTREKRDKSPGEESQKKSINGYYYKKGKPLKSERTLVSFLVSNGVSYDALEDPSFHHIQHAVSRLSSLNEPSLFDTVVDELSIDIKKLSGVKVDSSITATVDFDVHDDDVFMALSLHHFGDESFRHSNVFLKKIIGTELNENNLLYSILETLKDFNYDASHFSNIVVNQKYEGIVEKMRIDQTIYCAYAKLNDFANDVMKIPAFQIGIEKLYNFFKLIQNDLVLYTKFELIRKSKNSKFDLTQLKKNDWQAVTDCVHRSIKNTETFTMLSTFARRWELPNWLNMENVRNLSLMVNFFQELQQFGKVLSATDSMISNVVPTVSEISKYIKRFGAFENLEQEVQKVFDIHLEPFLDSSCDSIYDIAAYLDPRFSKSCIIYEMRVWDQIEMKLRKVLLNSCMNLVDNTLPSTSTSSGEVVINNEITKELNHFLACLHTSRPGFQNKEVYDWWTINKNRFPMLYRKARDVLSIPACTLDADYYFGRRGKLSHMISTMTSHQLVKALIVVSKNETFQGKGSRPGPSIHEKPIEEGASTPPPPAEQFISEKPPPLPERIANMACAKRPVIRTDFENLAIKERKRLEKRMRTLSPSRFIVENETDDTVIDLDDYLMCPPAPVLERMIEKEEFVKIENELKKELEEEEEESFELIEELKDVKKEEPDFGTH